MIARCAGMYVAPGVRVEPRGPEVRQVLDCARPLALLLARSAEGTLTPEANRLAAACERKAAEDCRSPKEGRGAGETPALLKFGCGFSGFTRGVCWLIFVNDR